MITRTLCQTQTFKNCFMDDSDLPQKESLSDILARLAGGQSSNRNQRKHRCFWCHREYYDGERLGAFGGFCSKGCYLMSMGPPPR